MNEQEAALRAALERIREAEAIDAKHGFRLPGDSALYITLWAMECELGEAQRAREAGASSTDLNPWGVAVREELGWGGAS